MNNDEIKLKMLENCRKWAQNRQKTAENVQNGIRESLLNETKSSAGDKHETGRAMLQIERENIGKQLNEIQKIIATIDRTEINNSSDQIKLGSLVVTDSNNYFVCVSAGAFKENGIQYYAVSVNSPIGAILLGKKEGDELQFQKNKFRITKLY